jgi:hypothetical protein
MDKIILTATNSTTMHAIELSQDAGIDELFNAFKSLLIGLTYHNSTIDNHILDMSETIKLNDNERI